MTDPGTVKGWGGVVYDLPVLPPSKDDAPCCLARALPDGRPPIGFCSPECVRRPAKN